MRNKSLDPTPCVEVRSPGASATEIASFFSQPFARWGATKLQGNKMRMSRWFLIAILGIFVGACATTQKFSDEDRQKISVVRLNSAVQKAPNMYYLGPGTSTLFAFGAIGGAAAAASSVEPAKTLQEFAEKNGIFIEKIVFQETDAALRSSGKLKVAGSGEAAEATINMLVYHYGFSVPNGFSSKLLPVVAVRFEMVDATGRIVWSANEGVSLLGSPIAPMTLEAMREDPKRIEDAWRSAAKRVAGNIAKAL